MATGGAREKNDVGGGFRRPWEPCQPGFELELQREVGERHVLFGLRAKSVARRCDCDDVLFEVEGAEKPLAVVHLTYAGRERDPQWPETELYDSWEDWRQRRMLPDSQEYEDAVKSREK